MPDSNRPPCIGLFGAEIDCNICDWMQECQKMSESIEAAVFRKGTHVRLTGKYKEKKYKPKRVP